MLCVCTVSLGLERIQCEACRVKTKHFILLRLHMAAKGEQRSPCERDIRVCMALKLNRNLENNIPTKNIVKSEKVYPVCFPVFSRLLSASKRRFEDRTEKTSRMRMSTRCNE